MYYLGIDGGGTKTKFILCNELGVLISESTQATCHYMQCGLEGVSKIIDLGLNDCLDKAQLNKQDIVSAFGAMPGYGDVPSDETKIYEAVNKSLTGISFKIGNDTENALAASLVGKAGINIIAGTGSIGLGVDETNHYYRCAGWHHFFGGDEGSAYWISCKMLLAFTCQSDGRETKTLLYTYLKEKYHLINDGDILALTIDEMQCDRTKIADMATTVYELALLNDPTALSIYKSAAFELSKIAITIKNNLNFEKPISLSYSGGVFKSGHFILDPLKEYLNNTDIIMSTPILEPSAGSIILAMKNNGIQINETIIANLKNI